MFPGTYALVEMSSARLPFTAPTGVIVYSGTLVVDRDGTWRSELESSQGPITDHGEWSLEGNHVTLTGGGSAAGEGELADGELVLDGGGSWTYRWRKR